MATKTTNGKKASGKTKKARKRASGFQCPNPGPKLTLFAFVEKMIEDSDFASFIHDLLCSASRGNRRASECLNSYFQPRIAELSAICIPASERRALLRCTEHNHLVAVVAFRFASRRKRVSEG